MTEYPANVDMTEIIIEATRIAKIHLPESANDVAVLRDAYENFVQRDASRLISLMIDDARDESSDYFSSLPSAEYSRRYDALHTLLTTMLYPVILSALSA